MNNQLLTTSQIVEQATALLIGRLGSVFASQDVESAREAVESAPDACQCCGSRDYVLHAGRGVCSYCRVPKSGSSPRVVQSNCSNGEEMITRFDILYGASVMRPDIAIRL